MHHHEDDVVLAEGKFLRFLRRGRWEFVTRKELRGIVGIVAVTPDGKLLLVEQYREAVACQVIELPAGLVGDIPGEEEEAFEVAARRELEEETGYTADRLRFLAEGPPSAGITNEIITLYLAEGVRNIGDGGGDETEDITVHAVPLDTVPAWLDARRHDGVLVDLRIYTGLYFLQQR